ncbi:hypothetical protein FB446DRAFT_26444 [Lentinula raphanica]|uniref:F-box domain-containing protein n=1 Tax=Lentinula raphanica TaxID=153919 RepID=A0AA38PM05_9AGAR|nr:hypothetical protein FB446DRAFT_26444 [Lentinula raphanica]KAJ3845418.1 hypothetical protein F5878DRAFT_599494 [Lentinula raphanica]
MSTNANSCPQCGYSLRHHAPPALPCDNSRIEQLLATNEYPNQKEELAFRTFVANAPCAISHFDDRIASLKAELLKVEAEKANFTSVFPKYQKPLNPVRRIPPEILQLIFKYGTGYDKPAKEYFESISHSLDVHFPLLVYGRVCHYWRNLIALGMPKLWTRIKLQLDRPMPTQRVPHASSLLSIYLRRSQKHPLTICLDIPRFKSMDFGTGFLVREFFKESARWKSLFVSGGDELDNIIAMSELSYDSLESVHIRRIDAHSVSLHHHCLPKLTTWTSILDGPSAGNGCLPLAFLEITDYTISGVWNCNVVKFVQHLRCLRTLSIQSVVLDVSSLSKVPDFKLTVLKELHIRQDLDNDCNNAAIAALLDSISCPALTTLSLFASEKLVKPLQQFEERSNFKLERFVGSEHAGIFVKAFRNRDALETMQVEGSYTTPATQDVLANLYISSQSTVFTSTNTKTPFPFTFPSPSLDKPIVKFPNLRRLQSNMCDLESVDAFMDRAYSNLCARENVENVVPLELVITTSDEKAQKMLQSPNMKKFADLKVTMKIIGV